MSRRDLSVKGGTSERCYRTRHGRTDEQQYAIISPYFDGRIKMNGLYPEITNISFLAKLFFKTFISLKHLSDYRTVGPSDYRTVGLSDCRTIGLSDYSYGPKNSYTKYLHLCSSFTKAQYSFGFSDSKLHKRFRILQNVKTTLETSICYLNPIYILKGNLSNCIYYFHIESQKKLKS